MQGIKGYMFAQAQGFGPASKCGWWFKKKKQMRFWKPKIAPCYQTLLRLTKFRKKSAKLATLPHLAHSWSSTYSAHCCSAFTPCCSVLHGLFRLFADVTKRLHINGSSAAYYSIPTLIILDVITLHKWRRGNINVSSHKRFSTLYHKVMWWSALSS